MRDNLQTRHRFVAAFLLAMTLAHGVVFWQERTHIMAGYGDFSALYTSGLMLRRGQRDLLYDRRVQWNLQREFAPNVEILKGPRPFIRPPYQPQLPTLPRRMIAAGLLLVICSPLYWALILRLDRPYLLALPMFVL